MFKLQALANRFFIYQKCKPKSLYYCSRLKKSKQPKPYITYRMSGFMLTISLAGFLIAKQGGFLQLACWVLHPSCLWPACLSLGFCFLIMRLLTANSLCLSIFFSRRNQGKTYHFASGFPCFLFVTIPIVPLFCIALQPTVYNKPSIAINDLILSLLLLLIKQGEYKPKENLTA